MGESSGHCNTDSPYFSRQFLDICYPEFAAALLRIEPSSPQENQQLSQPEDAVKEETDGQLKSKCEGLLHAVFALLQPLVFPQQPTEADIVHRDRLRVIVEISKKAIRTFAFSKDVLQNGAEAEAVVERTATLIYVVVLYSVFDFSKEKVKWLKGEGEERTINVYGFWLDHWRTAHINFTEASLLIPLAILEAMSIETPHIYSDRGLDSSRLKFRELLKKQMESKPSVVGNISPSDRWAMFDRSLKFVIQGIFEADDSLFLDVLTGGDENQE